MKRTLSVSMALLLAATLAGADVLTPETRPGTKSITMLSLYDLDDTSKICCSSIGRRNAVANGTARESDYEPPLKIKTVGTDSVTVSDTAASGALANVNLGDLIAVYMVSDECPVPGVACRIERVVTVDTSDDEVTVFPAWDLTGGHKFFWRNVVCGDDETSGAILVSDLDNFQLTVHVAQMTVDTGGINVWIEARQKGGVFLVVEPVVILTGGNDVSNFLARVYTGETWDAIRACYAVVDDDAVDTLTDAEQINVYFSGKKVLADE